VARGEAARHARLRARRVVVDRWFLHRDRQPALAAWPPLAAPGDERNPAARTTLVSNAPRGVPACATSVSSTTTRRRCSAEPRGQRCLASARPMTRSSRERPLRAAEALERPRTPDVHVRDGRRRPPTVRSWRPARCWAGSW
jgi:hypothetical protein